MAAIKGHVKQGGREKGTPNKVTKSVREAFQMVFTKLQEDEKQDYSLVKWAQDNPKDFYNLASKLIPLQITGEDGEPITINFAPVGKGRTDK